MELIGMLGSKFYLDQFFKNKSSGPAFTDLPLLATLVTCSYWDITSSATSVRDAKDGERQTQPQDLPVRSSDTCVSQCSP